MSSLERNHAIVMGASMAGLLAARVLSEHFAQVTILERDCLPTNAVPRKGVPQGHHGHALLARGYQILTRLFPTIERNLHHRGAIISDIRGRYDFYYRGYWPHMDTGMVFVGISRPALEEIVRNQVCALNNVCIKQAMNVSGLSFSKDATRVTGIHLQQSDSKQPETILADLVIDATGRGSRLPKWLKAAGYSAPRESTVQVDIKYATRIYSRSASNEEARTSMVMNDPPHSSRAGVAIPIEDNRYMVTMAEMFSGTIPNNHESYLNFARSLAAPNVYNLLCTEEPLSDIETYNFPKSLWRHYEHMARFPLGLIAVGDAVSSFNPIYGQGMTVSAMDAEALLLWLEHNHSDVRPLIKKIAHNVNMAWGISVGADFAFPQTKGNKALGTDLVNSYITQLTKKAVHNETLTRAFFEVNQMVKNPSSLFHPAIVKQVFFGPAPKTAKYPSQKISKTLKRMAEDL